VKRQKSVIAFQAGDRVHVAGFGSGVVREVRNGGRYLVDVKGTAMVVAATQLAAAQEGRRSRRPGTIVRPSGAPDPLPRDRRVAASIDLHGRTAAEAEAALDEFLNDALLGGLAEVRIIHGRSGGRVKAAVQARLRRIPAVRAFGLDPSNPGVTIVRL
jgi:DNA mismatch repair protein MutS2